VTIPPLIIESAHLALTVPVDEPVPHTSNVVQQLSSALKGEFHGVLEPGVPEGAPAEIPYVMFQGANAQFAFSQIQLDYEATFTGTYRKDYGQCKDFVAKKAAALLGAWEKVDAHPVWETLAITLHASTGDLDQLVALQHISETLLHTDTSDDMLAGVGINYSLHVLSKYNATISVSEYERRHVEQHLTPGVAAKPIRPWEAKLTDRGLQVAVEVNNRYGAMLEEKHTRVVGSELRFMNGLTWHIVEHVAVPLVLEGVLNTESLQRVVA
jgi:hypothetical protein